MKHLRRAQKTFLSYSFAIMIVVGAVVLLTDNQPAAQAQAPGAALNGYAWSENVGWISFNGVSVLSDGFILTGYAYSENIGYITFTASELSGCSSTPCSARLTNAPNYKLSGWARACSVFLSNCSGALDIANNGGWDGWINLEPSSNPAGTPAGSLVTFNGSAWGSDVLGTISYSSTVAPAYGVQVATVPPTCSLSQIAGPKIHWTTSNAVSGIINPGSISMSPIAAGDTGVLSPGTYSAYLNGSGTPCASIAVANTPPSGTFSATSPVRKGGSTTLSWSGIADASSCTISANPSAGLGGDYTTGISSPSTPGTRTATNLQTSPTIFTLMCVPSAGGAAVATGQPATVIVTPIPKYREI